jgi:putative methionine-R-sulfoxide reductase with GAF domain
MSEGKGRPATPSDRPPEDLKKERDAFFQQFFRKGAQFTEELLKENERLREQIAELELNNQKLRAHLASDEAMRDLLRKIEELEGEKKELLSQSATIKAATAEFSDRYAEIESELANLANLYIATSQLHAAHSVRTVLRNLKEMLAQLLGAQVFAIYLQSEAGGELIAIASEGANASDLARIPLANGPVGTAFANGEVVFENGVDVSQGTLERPAAVIPLRIDGRTIGVIAIVKTLPQKTEFVHVDGELFKVLSAQAAPALVNARLFTDAGRKVPGLGSFVDLED